MPNELNLSSDCSKSLTIPIDILKNQSHQSSSSSRETPQKIEMVNFQRNNEIVGNNKIDPSPSFREKDDKI